MSTESTKKALFKHHERILEESRRGPSAGPRRKNKKPEKEVEKACMEWFKDNGFSMDVVESKAVYSVSSGGYRSGQTVPGFTDSAGCTPDGYGCFVEFKAKGKKYNVSQVQKEFIKEKIYRGCFAIVVDNVELLQQAYLHWKMLDREDRITFLYNTLPKVKVKNDPDFDLE